MSVRWRSASCSVSHRKLCWALMKKNAIRFRVVCGHVYSSPSSVRVVRWMNLNNNQHLSAFSFMHSFSPSFIDGSSIFTHCVNI